MCRMKIKKMLAVLAACLLATGLLISQAGATSFCPGCTEIVFTYNATITTSGLDFSSGPYGTMTLTDNGDNIQMDIDLTGLSDGYDIRAYYLNWNQTGTPVISVVGTGGSVGDNYSSSFGTYQPSSAYNGTFDIWFNADIAVPTPPDEPYSGTVSAVLNLEGFNLDPCFFYETDNFNNGGDGTGQVYSLLRVFTGGSQYWIAATTTECTTAPVPEPSTLLLLGGGLAGLAGVTWRRRKNG